MATQPTTTSGDTRWRARGSRALVKTIDVIAIIVLILGGLNWGAIGIARYDVIAEIFGKSFGHTTAITRLIYIIVGLAALYVIWFRVTGIRRPGQPRI